MPRRSRLANTVVVSVTDVSRKPAAASYAFSAQVQKIRSVAAVLEAVPYLHSAASPSPALSVGSCIHEATVMRTAFASLTIIVLAASCSQPAEVNLSTSLEAFRNPSSSRAPGPQAWNTTRGDRTGCRSSRTCSAVKQWGSPGRPRSPSSSCSVEAVFEHDRLVSSNFSGNAAMCNAVFAPCLGQ